MREFSVASRKGLLRGELYKGCPFVRASPRPLSLRYLSPLRLYSSHPPSLSISYRFDFLSSPGGIKYLINSLRRYTPSRVGSRRNKSSTKFYSLPPFCTPSRPPPFCTLLFALYFLYFLFLSNPLSFSRTYLRRVLQLFRAVSRNRKSLSAKFRGLLNSRISQNEILLPF